MFLRDAIANLQHFCIINEYILRDVCHLSLYQQCETEVNYERCLERARKRF